MYLRPEIIKNSLLKFFLFNFEFSARKKKIPFSYKVKCNEVTFRWKSNKSDSHSLFYLQRKSSDSNHWIQTDFLDNTDGLYGSGIYLYDLHTVEGEYYYRLKKKETDGSIQYFEAESPLRFYEEVESFPPAHRLSLFHYPNSRKTEIVIKFILPKPTYANGKK